MKTKVPALSAARRLQLEKLAIGLSRNCPVDRSNPRNCPLFGLRPLFARDRKAWIRHLALEELEYLATYHAYCAGEKARTARPA